MFILCTSCCEEIQTLISSQEFNKYIKGVHQIRKKSQHQMYIIVVLRNRFNLSEPGLKFTELYLKVMYTVCDNLNQYVVFNNHTIPRK